jgi:hypothetical protein
MPGLARGKVVRPLSERRRETERDGWRRIEKKRPSAEEKNGRGEARRGEERRGS